MAEKRMFSKLVIDSDDFLDLPLSTQALYFHLSMRADDDGFINNAKKIMKIIGGNQNDYDLLVMKSYVIQFPDGICVIRHWRINNYLRSDRYKSTLHLEEKSMLNITENGIYEVKDTTYGIPLVYQSGTKVSIDKIREDKSISKKKSVAGQIPDLMSEYFIKFWKEYPRKDSRLSAEKAFAKLNVTEGILTQMLKKIETQKQSKQWSDKQFIPYPATWLNQKRWEDEEDEKEVYVSPLKQTGPNTFSF